MRIPVTKPYLPDQEKLNKYLNTIHSNAWLTNFGPLHQELTQGLEDYLGVRNLLLVSNGTLALQIAYKALNIAKKVYTSPFSFVATSSSLAWENINPHFIDVDESNLCLDPKLLPTLPSSEISGIVGVHVYGNCGDLASIDNYSQKSNLKVIYDGAHAFGVKKSGKSLLLNGDATTLSFHATKVFHTVEGGGIVFRDKKAFEVAKQLINFGMDEQKIIRSVGINSKLNEYQSAVGLVVLDDIEKIIEKRVEIFERYEKDLNSSVELIKWDHSLTKNGSYFPVIFENETQLLRVQGSLENDGIQTRRYFHPSLNLLEFYGQKYHCPNSEKISDRVLCLPMYYDLSRSEQDLVIDKLKKAL